MLNISTFSNKMWYNCKCFTTCLLLPSHPCSSRNSEWKVMVTLCCYHSLGTVVLASPILLNPVPLQALSPGWMPHSAALKEGGDSSYHTQEPACISQYLVPWIRGLAGVQGSWVGTGTAGSCHAGETFLPSQFRNVAFSTFLKPKSLHHKQGAICFGEGKANTLLLSCVCRT